MAGPRKGAPENMHIAKPRSDLSNMSAMSAGAFERGAEPIDPVKKRRTSKEAMDPAPAAPALNAVATMNVKKKTFFRP